MRRLDFYVQATNSTGIKKRQLRTQQQSNHSSKKLPSVECKAYVKSF